MHTLYKIRLHVDLDSNLLGSGKIRNRLAAIVSLSGEVTHKENYASPWPYISFSPRFGPGISRQLKWAFGWGISLWEALGFNTPRPHDKQNICCSTRGKSISMQAGKNSLHTQLRGQDKHPSSSNSFLNSSTKPFVPVQTPYRPKMLTSANVWCSIIPKFPTI